MTPNAAQMGIQTPYLIIKRPVLSYDQTDVAQMVGMPAGDVQTAHVRDFTGFVSATRAWVEIYGCTEQERQQIEQYLTEGIIV